MTYPEIRPTTDTHLRVVRDGAQSALEKYLNRPLSPRLVELLEQRGVRVQP